MGTVHTNARAPSQFQRRGPTRPSPTIPPGIAVAQAHLSELKKRYQAQLLNKEGIASVVEAVRCFQEAALYLDLY